MYSLDVNSQIRQQNEDLAQHLLDAFDGSKPIFIASQNIPDKDNEPISVFEGELLQHIVNCYGANVLFLHGLSGTSSGTSLQDPETRGGGDHLQFYSGERWHSIEESGVFFPAYALASAAQGHLHSTAPFVCATWPNVGILDSAIYRDESFLAVKHLYDFSLGKHVNALYSHYERNQDRIHEPNGVLSHVGIPTDMSEEELAYLLWMEGQKHPTAKIHISGYDRHFYKFVSGMKESYGIESLADVQERHYTALKQVADAIEVDDKLTVVFFGTNKENFRFLTYDSQQEPFSCSRTSAAAFQIDESSVTTYTNFGDVSMQTKSFKYLE